MEATVVTSFSPDSEYFALQDKTGSPSSNLSTTVLYGDDDNIILKLSHKFTADDADKTGYFVVQVGDVKLFSDKITFKNMDSKYSGFICSMNRPNQEILLSD